MTTRTRLETQPSHRKAQPIVCRTCYGLGYVVINLYDPATGRTVGEMSIDCMQCKGRKK